MLPNCFRSALIALFVQAAVSHSFAVAPDTVIYLNKRAVTLLTPQTKIKGTILMLPGWNYGRTDVCNKSTFCKKALAAGYRLILPEMGKSLYASVSYPETRKDWLAYPQLSFITDTLIPYFQQQLNCLQKGDNNFMYGISTGARGVTQVLIHTRQVFKAGVVLSGDYDQTLQPTDNLIQGWYGSYAQHTRRWQVVDNPLKEAIRIKVPLYIGHGEADKVVPVQQSNVFFQQLKKASSTNLHQLHLVKKASHDYIYWDSETDAVLLFLDHQCVSQ